MLHDVFMQKSIYKDVCEFLQLNLIKSVLFFNFRNLLILKTWQINDIIFIIQKEMFFLCDKDISDCCDLKKTVQTLMTTYLKSEFRFNEELFKSTLMLSSVSVVYVWALKTMCFFKRKLHTYIYHQFKEQMFDFTLKNMIINNVNLIKFLVNLNSDDLNMLKIIIVFSYIIWQNHTTIKISNDKNESMFFFYCS